MLNIVSTVLLQSNRQMNELHHRVGQALDWILQLVGQIDGIPQGMAACLPECASIGTKTTFIFSI